MLRYAFERARTRPARHLTSATKSNGIIHTMPFWDERFQVMAADYPDVQTDLGHADGAGALVSAVERVLAVGEPRPRDLGGTATTAEMTAAVIAALG